MKVNGIISDDSAAAVFVAETKRESEILKKVFDCDDDNAICISVKCEERKLEGHTEHYIVVSR